MEGCKHSFLVLVGLCTAAAFQTSEVLPPPPPPFDELISLDADRFAHLNATEFSLALSGTPPSADGGVLVALPRSVALTAKVLRNGALAHFLEAPTLIKSMAKNRIPKIPDSFVFALWYLFQLHAGDKPHAEPLWQAWAERHHYTYTPPPREQAKVLPREGVRRPWSSPPHRFSNGSLLIARVLTTPPFSPITR